MFFVVDFDQYRLGRPVVAIEHPTTKKLNEPGPMRVFVVVGSCVETYPNRLRFPYCIVSKASRSALVLGDVLSMIMTLYSFSFSYGYFENR